MAKQGNAKLVRDDQRIVCDFCSAEPVVWRYHVEGTVVFGKSDTATLERTFLELPQYPFHLEGEPLPEQARILHTSTDDWAACAACGELLQAGDLPGVGARAVERIVSKYPQIHNPRTVRDLAEQIRNSHAQFYGAWTGRRSPYPEEKETP